VTYYNQCSYDIKTRSQQDDTDVTKDILIIFFLFVFLYQLIYLIIF